MTNDFSGGLRGLRPPATFFATLRVAEEGQLDRFPPKGEQIYFQPDLDQRFLQFVANRPKRLIENSNDKLFSLCFLVGSVRKSNHRLKSGSLTQCFPPPPLHAPKSSPTQSGPGNFRLKRYFPEVLAASSGPFRIRLSNAAEHWASE